jgi:hypothetical protein
LGRVGARAADPQKGALPMRRKALMRDLALFAAAVFTLAAVAPLELADAASGVYIGRSWVYDWAWRGYYVLYRTDCDRGHTYVIEVVPETRVDDPDLYVGTRRPRGTNSSYCSPNNYLWKSTRGRGQTDRIRFTAGYSGRHYFSVYAYAPNWTGWYVRVRRVS